MEAESEFLNADADSFRFTAPVCKYSTNGEMEKLESVIVKYEERFGSQQLEVVLLVHNTKVGAYNGAWILYLLLRT